MVKPSSPLRPARFLKAPFKELLRSFILGTGEDGCVFSMAATAGSAATASWMVVAMPSTLQLFLFHRDASRIDDLPVEVIHLEVLQCCMDME